MFSSFDRFEERYRRRRQHGHNPLKKWAVIVSGVLLILLGILLLPLPGPGMLIIAAGAALMAQESLVAARALDRAISWAKARFPRMFRRRRAAPSTHDRSASTRGARS